MDAIQSQPCTRRRVSGEAPGKSGDCMCRLIEFSFDWPTKIQEMIGGQADETWEVQPKSGKNLQDYQLQGWAFTMMVRFPKKGWFPGDDHNSPPKKKLIEEAEEELERLKIEEDSA